MTPSRDAVMGCILGGAIGDCVGGVAENSRLCLSDDTQLTLATCEAMCARGEVLPEQISRQLDEIVQQCQGGWVVVSIRQFA